MAPEGLDKDFRVIGKSDLYSFAVTVLFLMFPVDLAIKLLYLPILEDLEILIRSLSRFELLDMIFKSLRCDPSKRVAIESWSNVFERMKDFDINVLIGKITSEILERNGVVLNPLNKALEMEEGFYFNLEFFGNEMSLENVNKNEAWKMTSAVSHMQNLSSIFCDQTYLSKGVI